MLIYIYIYIALLRVCCRLCDKMLLKSMLSDVALACNMWFKKLLILMVKMYKLCHQNRTLLTNR